MNSPSSEVDGWLMREKWRALVLSDLLVYVRYKRKTICRWQDNWCTSNMIFLWWWASLFLQCHDVEEATCYANNSMPAGAHPWFPWAERSPTCRPLYVRHNQCIFVLITLYVFLENFGCLLIQEKNVIFTFSERKSELLNVICISLLIQSLEMSGQTSSAWLRKLKTQVTISPSKQKIWNKQWKRQQDLH